MEMVEEGTKIPPNRSSQEIAEKGEDDDRISSLPDCLLLEILSHLPSTKTAITTGTLSKRWEHLWTLVPTLIFEEKDDKQSSPDFVSLVDKTLAQCRQSKLKKFEVIYTRDYHEHVSQPNGWIRYALRCNVEVLTLTLGNGISSLQVDESIFTASCLTNLRLIGCSLNPTGDISWKNLKSLYIFLTELNGNLIKNILSGSPVLETLVLDECYGLNRLDIDSKSLKNLVFKPYMDLVNAYDDDFDSETQIYAPNISSLTVQGDLCVWKLLLVDVSSLIEAKLDYTNHWLMHRAAEEEEMLKGLLLKLGHVKKLTIGGYCSKVLSRLEAKGFVIPSNSKLVDGESD